MPRVTSGYKLDVMAYERSSCENVSVKTSLSWNLILMSLHWFLKVWKIRSGVGVYLKNFGVGVEFVGVKNKRFCPSPIFTATTVVIATMLIQSFQALKRTISFSSSVSKAQCSVFPFTVGCNEQLFSPKPWKNSETIWLNGFRKPETNL